MLRCNNVFTEHAVHVNIIIPCRGQIANKLKFLAFFNIMTSYIEEIYRSILIEYHVCMVHISISKLSRNLYVCTVSQHNKCICRFLLSAFKNSTPLFIVYLICPVAVRLSNHIIGYYWRLSKPAFQKSQFLLLCGIISAAVKIVYKYFLLFRYSIYKPMENILSISKW